MENRQQMRSRSRPSPLADSRSFTRLEEPFTYLGRAGDVREDPSFFFLSESLPRLPPRLSFFSVRSVRLLQAEKNGVS